MCGTSPSIRAQMIPFAALEPLLLKQLDAFELLAVDAADDAAIEKSVARGLISS